MTVAILADSTSDLGLDLAGRHQVDIIPLPVTVGERVFLDGVDLQQEQLFDLVTSEGLLPKTAAPSVGEFTAFFDRPGEMVFIGISSRLSATLQNASLAAQAGPAERVQLVDSLNLSTGIGLLVLRAADRAAAGCHGREIADEVRRLVPKVRTSFMIDTMDYLYKGGRCTALQAIAGSVLKIHPVIEVRPDGTLGVKEKSRGTRQRGLQLMLEDFASHLPELDRERVFVTHTTSPEEAEFLKQEIERMASPAEVLITRAGSVISSHCGPGTIGILFLVR